MSQQITPTKTSLVATDDDNEDIKQQPQMYPKNSLDRFGDDFSQVLLSYLTFEDRFRLECVSKQFQRTVFDSVVDISVDDNLIIKILKSKNSIIEMMSRIAIKCPNIERLDCRGMITFNAFLPEVLKSLRDNCHHFREICCHLTSKADEWIQEFGPLVTRIEGVSGLERHSLIHCNQLSQITVRSLSALFSAFTGQLMIENLLYIEFVYNGVEDNQLFAQLVARNQSLTSLCVDAINIESEAILTELEEPLKQLSKLRHLSLKFGGISSPLADSMTRIGNQCKQLESISLYMCTLSEQNAHFLTKLSFNPRIKRLEVTFNLIGSAVEAIVNESFAPLRHCRRLTHLTIYCCRISAQLLANFLRDKPRLHYLTITGPNWILNQCLSHIARLPALQTLIVQTFWSTDYINYLNESFVRQLIPKLKRVSFVQNNC